MSPRVLTLAELEIGGVALLTLLAGLLVAATMSPGTLDRQEVLGGAEVPEHRIFEVEEQIDGRLLTAHVEVGGTPEADSLIAVVAAVVDAVRDERGYSGLRINLYDHEAYRAFGITLGQALDAPDGEWAQAIRSTRDYRLHRTVIEVRDKDWDQQPEDRHIEAAIAWHQEQQGTIRPVGDEQGATEAGDDSGDTASRESETLEPPPGLEQIYTWSVSGEPLQVVLE